MSDTRSEDEGGSSSSSRSGSNHNDSFPNLVVSDGLDNVLAQLEANSRTGTPRQDDEDYGARFVDILVDWEGDGTSEKLAPAAEVKQKESPYYGDSGRQMFHQRYQWISRQRNVAMTSPQAKNRDNKQVTYFAETHDKQGERDITNLQQYSPTEKKSGANARKICMKASSDTVVATIKFNSNKSNKLPILNNSGDKKGESNKTKPPGHAPLSSVLLTNSLNALSPQHALRQGSFYSPLDKDNNNNNVSSPLPSNAPSPQHSNLPGSPDKTNTPTGYSTKKSLTGFVGFSARDKSAHAASPLHITLDSPRRRLAPSLNSLGTAATIIGPVGTVAPIIVPEDMSSELDIPLYVVRGEYGSLSPTMANQAYQGFAATLVMQRQSELFTQAGVYHPTILTQRESFSPARLSPPGISFNDMVESKGGGGGGGGGQGQGPEEISYWSSLASFEVDEELQKAQDSAAEAEDDLLLNDLTTKLTQHNFAHDAVADPISPRTKFITSCLHEGLNPRAGLLIRRRMANHMNLSHMTLGDKVVRLLAQALGDLPDVESLDLSDNNITDASVVPLLAIAMDQSSSTGRSAFASLRQLDLSDNSLGTPSALALAAYLSQQPPNQCSLRRLFLRNCKITDSECDQLVTSILSNNDGRGNESLEELDLSSNLIGANEDHQLQRGTNNKSNVKCPPSGGLAIAELLKSPTSPLKVLKLAWNSLRLQSGIELCLSLADNQCLTYLDVGSNSLGPVGGEALGSSLMSNRVLRHLNVSNNGLDARACFTLCIGVLEHPALTKVIMDGNPVGMEGAKALMLVPLLAGDRVELSSAGCNINITTSTSPKKTIGPGAIPSGPVHFDGTGAQHASQSFNTSSPCGDYHLDLSKPYQRAIALCLLRLVAVHQTWVLSETTIDGSPLTLTPVMTPANPTFLAGRANTSDSHAYTMPVNARTQLQLKNLLDIAAKLQSAGYGEDLFKKLVSGEWNDQFNGTTAAAAAAGSPAKIISTPNSRPTSALNSSDATPMTAKDLQEKDKAAEWRSRRRVTVHHREENTAVLLATAHLRATHYAKWGVGAMDVQLLRQALRIIGFDYDARQTHELMSMFDVDYSGLIELDEFLALLRHRGIEVDARISNLVGDLCLGVPSPTGTYVASAAAADKTGQNAAGLADDTTKYAKYKLPLTGMFKLKLSEGTTAKSIYKVLTAGEQEYLIKVARDSGHAMTILEHVLQHVKLHLAEAIRFFEVMHQESGRTNLILSKLLPLLADPEEANQLLLRATRGERHLLARLAAPEIEGTTSQTGDGMASTLKTFSDRNDGYYSLDMISGHSHQCLRRLLEINETLKEQHASKSPLGYGRVGDTSQSGNWTCFRNELLDGQPFQITFENFQLLPKKGILEFDFVAFRKTPAPTEIITLEMVQMREEQGHTTAGYKLGQGGLGQGLVSEKVVEERRYTIKIRRLFSILSTCQLMITEDDRVEALEYANKCREDCNLTCKGSGITITTVSEQRAAAIRQHEDAFYSHLKQRHAQVWQAKKEEMNKVDYLKAVGVDKDGEGEGSENPEPKSTKNVSPSKKSKKEKSEKKVAASSTVTSTGGVSSNSAGAPSGNIIPGESKQGTTVIESEGGEGEVKAVTPLKVEQRIVEIHSLSSASTPYVQHKKPPTIRLPFSAVTFGEPTHGQPSSHYSVPANPQSGPYDLRAGLPAAVLDPTKTFLGLPILLEESLAKGIPQLQKTITKRRKQSLFSRYNKSEFFSAIVQFVPLWHPVVKAAAKENMKKAMQIASFSAEQMKVYVETGLSGVTQNQPRVDDLTSAVTVPQSTLQSPQPRLSLTSARGEMSENNNEQQQDSEIRKIVTIPKDRDGVHVVSFPIAPYDSEYGDIEDGERTSNPHGNADHALGSVTPPGEMFRQASTVSGSKPTTPVTNNAGVATTSSPTIAPTSSGTTTTQALTAMTNQKLSMSEVMQYKIDSAFAGSLTSRANTVASPMTAEELASNADLRLDNVAIDFQLLLACRQVSKRVKAARLLEYLEEAFSKVWLKSRHLAVIVKAFEAYGSIDRTDYFGSYRVDLIVTCFSRIVDVHNFELVMTCLTAYEAACVYCRIGWLKVFNPMKPEGSYELDVSLWEERMIVKTLCTLATNEPGENWPCFSYRYSDNNNTPAEIIPGWSLTSLWLQDNAMPKRGVLSLLFYTGDGIGNFGCYAHVALRRALCAMFWVDEADHQPDFEIDRLDPNSATMALAMYRRDQKSRRGNTLTLENNPSAYARINIADRSKARAQQESVHGKYWKVDKKTLGRTASVMLRDGPGDDMAEMLATHQQDPGMPGDNESTSVATGPSFDESNDDVSLDTSVSHESFSLGSQGLGGMNRRSSYSIRRLSTHSLNESHQFHASVKHKDNQRQPSRGNLSKDNSSHIQPNNPHSELTSEQIAKLEHVKDQGGISFVDPEGGGETLSALLARMTTVSALSELKNAKNALDAKALAESDGTSETMQIILFPKKKRRRTNNDNPDNNRKSTAVKPGDKDYNGDKKNPDDSAAAGPKIELFFRLGEMFMKENPKSWLTYFYPSGGTSGGAED